MSPCHTTLLARCNVLYLPATGVRKRGATRWGKAPSTTGWEKVPGLAGIQSQGRPPNSMVRTRTILSVLPLALVGLPPGGEVGIFRGEGGSGRSTKAKFFEVVECQASVKTETSGLASGICRRSSFAVKQGRLTCVPFSTTLDYLGLVYSPSIKSFFKNRCIFSFGCAILVLRHSLISSKAGILSVKMYAWLSFPALE